MGRLSTTECTYLPTYLGHLNLFWYVLLLTLSIGTKSAKCIG